MATITLKGQEARDALAKGINELADIVCVTMGPKGRNVAIDKRWSAPQIIHDGVSVAKAISPKDPFAAMGAELLKEAASKTADIAGDGTTTATLLAQTIINEGQKRIKEGANPMVLKKGIDNAVLFVVEELKKQAKVLNSDTEIAQIATISAANPQVGNLIAEALRKIGKEGVITVEEGVTGKTEVEYREGMQFDHGYQVNAFVTNKDKALCEIADVSILFADFAISSPDEMATFLEKFVQAGKSKNIVFITDGVEDKALMTLIINGQNGRATIKTCAISAPGIGTKRQELLEDMAILTGGKAAFKQNGVTLENIGIEALGSCDKIEISDLNTKIIGGRGNKLDIKNRIQHIKDLIAKETSDFEKEKLHERLSKLDSGVAIIKVGAATDTEMHDLKERVIDAVAATKSAIAEGIVAGGGVTLLKIREVIKPLQGAEGDEATGMTLVYNALEEPIKRLLANGGIEKGKELPLDGKTGINIETGEQVNMFEAGIIDPAKVTRLAIQSAASVAAMILTTDGAITEIPEDTKSPLEIGQMQ